MAKLPDAQSVFGGLGNLSSHRPIATYDDTAIARGGIAMGNAIDTGTDKLASGIESIGKAATAIEKDNTQLELSKANAHLVSGQIDLNSEFEKDTDYKTQQQRYQERLDKLKTEAEGMISSPAGREKFNIQAQDDIARGRARISHQVFQKEGQAQTGYVLGWGDNQQRKLPDIDDPASRRRVIDTYHGMVDGLSDAGHVTPVQALSMKRQFADQYIAADAQGLIERDPAAAARRLESPDKNDIYAHLQPDQRRILLSRARSGLMGEQFSVKEAINDDVDSVLKTGQGVPGLTAERIKTAYGPKGDQAISQWQSAREDAGQIWTSSHDFPSLTETEIYDRVDAAQPKAGAPGFTRQQAVHDALVKRADDMTKLRRDDPASAVSSDPAVKAAQSTIKAGTAGGWPALGRARIEAQTRLGIDEASQSPITKDEALKMTAPLRTMIPGQENAVVTNLAKELQDMFGDHAEPAFSYALRAHRVDAATAAAAGKVMGKLGLWKKPGATDNLDQVSEIGAADQAIGPGNIGSGFNFAAPNYGTGLLAPQGAPPAAPPGANIPRRAIDYLRKNPDSKAKFEAEYGAGSAARILKEYPVGVGQ